MRTMLSVGAERVARVGLVLLMLPLPATGWAQTPTLETQAAPIGAPAAAPAASAPAATAPATSTQLDEARELIKTGDHDRAIDLLRATIARPGESTENLREAYLLLIKTYVFLGNDFKFKSQGREASNLNYRAARELIAEVLEVPALRHTQPEPATDYPPKMITFFAEVRSRLFGAFRVIALEPPTALVLLDGDTLGVPPGESAPGGSDLPIGSHAVTVRAAGFKELNDTITISPNATIERNYVLEKRRGAAWYASRAAGALGLVGGAIALFSRNGKSDSPEPLLPGAPPPP